MTISGTPGGEPDGYDLLHLLTQARSDGQIVQYYVCFACLDLVERTADQINFHDCMAVTRQVRELELSPSVVNPSLNAMKNGGGAALAIEDITSQGATQ